ncbi:DNA cytosine methyltransferase [Dyadobacter sp. 32]|uniref:DNA cytosine methyltransferase n=1 Tax=Dyadobacter sp. 32 TaxID=538966 RepID=UPI0039C606A8
MDQKKSFIAVESFAGAGGLSIGLQRAGFDVRYAFDNNEWAVKSYNNYIPGNHCKVIDVNFLSGIDIMNEIGIEPGELDLFAGGPPCQGFSRQTRGAHNGDNRNNLVLEYARLVTELTPKVFLLENVDMLGLKRGEVFLKKVQEILSNYTLYPHFYNSADYNLAQTRTRFITVGVRKDLNVSFEIPKRISKNDRKTVGEVIGDLPEPPADFSPHPEIYNHQEAKITELNKLRFSHVPQGGGWKNIPFELRLKCHQIVNTSKGGWPDVYGRLDWNGQCPTITGGFDSISRGRYGHPTQDRALTAREAALLQGFPLNFEFMGNRGEVRKQIGNAVPPPLAEAIGIAIVTLLEQVTDLDEEILSDLSYDARQLA